MDCSCYEQDTIAKQSVFRQMEKGISGVYDNGTLRGGVRWSYMINTRGTVLHLLLDDPNCQTLYTVLWSDQLNSEGYFIACLESKEAIIHKFQPIVGNDAALQLVESGHCIGHSSWSDENMKVLLATNLSEEHMNQKLSVKKQKTGQQPIGSICSNSNDYEPKYSY